MKALKEKFQHLPKFWILGSIRTTKKRGRTTIKPQLEAYFEQPEVQKESYLYEITNEDGQQKQQLVWVMHPNNILDFPSLGKSIRVAGASTGETILSPE